MARNERKKLQESVCSLDQYGGGNTSKGEEARGHLSISLSI